MVVPEEFWLRIVIYKPKARGREGKTVWCYLLLSP